VDGHPAMINDNSYTWIGTLDLATHVCRDS